MPTQQLRLWAKNAGVIVSQWAADTMGIQQEKGDLTMQWKDNKVRERIWEIAQCMSISNKLGAGPEQWNLLIHCCVTWISDLISKRLLWKRYMADQTILDGQKLKAAVEEFMETCLRREMNRIHATPTQKRIFIHVGMYLIAPMLILLSLMMCR